MDISNYTYPLVTRTMNNRTTFLRVVRAALWSKCQNFVQNINVNDREDNRNDNNYNNNDADDDDNNCDNHCDSRNYEEQVFDCNRNGPDTINQEIVYLLDGVIQNSFRSMIDYDDYYEHNEEEREEDDDTDDDSIMTITFDFNSPKFR